MTRIRSAFGGAFLLTLVAVSVPASRACEKSPRIADPIERALDVCLEAAGSVDGEMQACYGQAARAWGTRMEAAYEQLRKAGGFPLIRKSQRLWLALRDADHAMWVRQSRTVGGGTLVGLQAAWADYERTRARALELETLSES